jgi:hypothetical protein
MSRGGGGGNCGCFDLWGGNSQAGVMDRIDDVTLEDYFEVDWGNFFRMKSKISLALWWPFAVESMSKWPRSYVCVDKVVELL